MSRHEQKRKLVGPWRNLHAAVWLIGMVILFSKGWWWPGILVLVAISMALEGLLMLVAPQAFEKEEPPLSQTPVAPVLAPASAPTTPENRFDLLPSICPRCGGPVRGQEVKWTGLRSVNCAYCGANLPLKKD